MPRILQRRMAEQTQPQVCPPILLAVQRRSNRPARHPLDRRQSYIPGFNLETGRPGQDTYWSPGHSEMPRESHKWSLVTRPQQTNRRSL